MKRLLLYIPLALMLMILSMSTAILLFVPHTVGMIRDVDARATQTMLINTLQASDSTAQFLSDMTVRDFSLNLTRTAIATQTDETIITRQAQAFATEQHQVNVLQSTLAVQSTQLYEAQAGLIGIQTQVASTATMNSLVVSVTLTAGAEFAQINLATRYAIIQAQSQLQTTATVLEYAIQTNIAQSNVLLATEAMLANVQMQLTQVMVATQTAFAFQNMAQATQNALSFEATQRMVQSQATQNAMNFAMTQSAIYQNATEVALGFATPLPTPLPTLTPSPTVFVDTFGGRQP